MDRDIALDIEKWKKRLSPNDFAELESLFDKLDQTISLQAASSYMNGFRDGARLGMEIVSVSPIP
ncbi:DUF6809 family protein [Saccharibacillus sacchari]|uniref:DUF6809 family protein n=1 Tax=Saccharibacillus sacchari TaxID=456493 RepID=UPI003CCA23F2